MLFIPISYFKQDVYILDFKSDIIQQITKKLFNNNLSKIKGDTHNLKYKYLIIRDSSNNFYTGFICRRRLLWLSPLLFLLNLLLYLPIFNISILELKMDQINLQNQIIYDGECPFCKSYVKFVKFKKMTNVELINARHVIKMKTIMKFLKIITLIKE